MPFFLNFQCLFCSFVVLLQFQNILLVTFNVCTHFSDSFFFVLFTLFNCLLEFVNFMLKLSDLVIFTLNYYSFSLKLIRQFRLFFAFIHTNFIKFLVLFLRFGDDLFDITDFDTLFQFNEFFFNCCQFIFKCHSFVHLSV